MVITGESADLINAIQAYDKIAVEINGHPIQANRLDNATSESPGRNQCQDSAQYASNCPGWKWACTDPIMSLLCKIIAKKVVVYVQVI
jgi:hypothetical protein